MLALLLFTLPAGDDSGKAAALPIQPPTIVHASAEVSIVRVDVFERMLRPGFDKPAKPMNCLGVKVRIRNISDDKTLTYRGWGVKDGRPDETTASAQTDVGPLMLRLAIGSQTPKKIPPRSQVEDVLPFIAPSDDCRAFHLTLPGDGLELDKPFTFTVRREAWAEPPKYDPNTISNIELVSFQIARDGAQASVLLLPSKKTMLVKAGQRFGKWKILAIDPASASIIVLRPDGMKQTIFKSQ